MAGEGDGVAPGERVTLGPPEPESADGALIAAGTSSLPGAAPEDDEGAPGTVASGGMSKTVVKSANLLAGSRVLAQVMQFATGLVLARLLLPSEFGLVASVSVVSNFAILLVDMGLGAALIQAEEPSQELKSTVFWANVGGGLLVLAVLAGLGPAVAAFYDQPQLTLLTPAVGLAFATSFGVVNRSMMMREFDYKALFVIDVGSVAVISAVTLALALAGAGPYSIAIGPAVGTALNSLLTCVRYPWRPRVRPTRAAARQLWSFGGALLGANVLSYWGRNVDNLLVGKVAGPAPLGYYNRAYALMLLPLDQIIATLNSIFLATLSRMTDDQERLRAAYLRASRAISLLTVPALAGLAVTAPAVVPLLWGDRWLPAVPLLQILCVAGIPQCLTMTLPWIYQSLNRNGLALRQGLKWTTFGIVAIAVASPWGATGVAVAVLVRFWVETPANLNVAGRLVGTDARGILRFSLPIYAATVLASAASWVLPGVAGLGRGAPTTFLLQVVAFLVVLGGGLAVWGRAALTDLRSVRGN